MRIRAGMTAKVDLKLSEMGEQLVVPDHALVQKNESDFIYVVEKGFAQLTEIDVLQTFGSNAIISSGLTPGDTVVVVGMKNLGVNTPVWVESVK